LKWNGFKLERILQKIMPSSVISRYSYDSATATLRVVFVSGVVYDYKKVPEEVYEAMKASASKGVYLNKFIKPVYSFEKITAIH